MLGFAGLDARLCCGLLAQMPDFVARERGSCRGDAENTCARRAWPAHRVRYWSRRSEDGWLAQSKRWPFVSCGLRHPRCRPRSGPRQVGDLMGCLRPPRRSRRVHYPDSMAAITECEPTAVGRPRRIQRSPDLRRGNRMGDRTRDSVDDRDGTVLCECDSVPLGRPVEVPDGI